MSQQKENLSTYVVAIAGGSGSGKTTLAKKVLHALGPSTAAIIGQDSYYYDQSKNFKKDGGDINFDHPSALEFSLLAKHLSELKRGQSINIPIYDFVTHSRTEHIEKLSPHPVTVLDGTLILSQPSLLEVIDYAVFLDVPEEVRFQRRLKRDVVERGRTEQGVKEQFIKQVKPMHDEFVQPSMKNAQLVVPMVYNDEEVLSTIEEAIQKNL